MKKLLLIAAFAVFGLSLANAQNTRFGVTAGYTSISFSAKADDVSASVSESGFYVGLLADIPTSSEKLHVQPSILYTNVSESNFLQIPVMVKYYVAEKFSLQGGPQANFVLDETGDDIGSLGIDLGFGAAFDIDDNFFIEARYAFEITNRIKDEVDGVDITGRFNTLNIGLGYKFN